MTDDCIFCQIVAGNIPSETVYQDDQVTAFRDVSPQTNVHVLVIPNQHYASLNDAVTDQTDLLAHALRICASVAKDEGIDERGYRVVTNVGDEGGQSVHHLHFHVLGGQELTGRMG